MSGARRGTDKTYSHIVSGISAVGDIINLGNIDVSKPHCFVGAQFFADGEGILQAIPDAGTVTIAVETLNTTPVVEDIPDGIIDATAPCTRSWAANTRRVIATPSGITVATHYRIVVTCNET